MEQESFISAATVLWTPQEEEPQEEEPQEEPAGALQRCSRTPERQLGCHA
jgi:hypothetical protein